MGLFKNLKQGLDAVRNPPDQAAIEASLASLTPEQRAAYDANMARVSVAQGESQASWEQAAAINREARVLGGPAGTYLYGASADDLGFPDELNARIAEVGVWQAQKALRAKRTGEFKAGVRQSFNRHEVPQEGDPVARERIAGEERAARAAARAPYRAVDAAHVAISRFATRGETQLEEVVAFLAAQGHAARPERVFGVYRVPDRISQTLTPHSERGRVVEWDVVHLPMASVTPGPAPALTSFGAGDQWVARRLGEPSVLDEDLGLAFLAEAGIGPERCLGLARYCEFRELRGGQEHEPIRTLVRGLVALHADVGPGPFEALRDRAPLSVPGEPAGVVCEILNWAEVAKAVRPKIHHPPPVPSPFPYLPSTPQELLRAYLEVVGIQPQDCYSAQATVDRARELQQGGLMTTNLGPKQPVADGKERMRSHGCEQVVVVYRDAPAYAAGRERWTAYEADVLLAGLRKGNRVRPRIADPDDLPDAPRGLKTIAKVAGTIDRITLLEFGEEKLPPHRYCWPPVG